MKKSNLIGLTIGLVIAVVVISLISWFVAKPVPNIIQGEVEVTSHKISSKSAGRIDSLFVKAGQKVSKGDLLFVIGTPEAHAKLMQAEAAKEAAAAQSMKADRGARTQEIAAAGDIWQAAEAARELAQKTYDRTKNLYEAGVVPAQKLDEATAMLKATANQASAAKSQYYIIMEGARSEDKASAAALVSQADGAVSEVESYISDAMQFSPVDGEVSTLIAEQDELIGTGYPVITLLDMSDVWVTFNIKENMMPKIAMDMVFDAYVPGLGKTIRLKVTYMAVQADYATWSATKTKGEFDIRTFEVRARLEEKIDGLRPGMTAAVNWDSI